MIVAAPPVPTRELSIRTLQFRHCLLYHRVIYVGRQSLQRLPIPRWARSEGLSDDSLRKAALEIEDGLVNARLGGFLIKKRVRAPGRGKSGGYRTIVAHRQNDRLVFLHGFAKNEKDNITKNEKEALHKLGDEYMGFRDAQLTKMAREGVIIEIEVKVS